MQIKTTVLAWLHIFMAACFFSCAHSEGKKNTKHYSEDMLQGFEKICDKQSSRDTGIYLMDSLYKTFPFISVADKYRYYYFMQKLFVFIRYGDRSYIRY